MTASSSLIDRVLADRYRVGALLGQGGMGAVLAADDLRTGRPVAIKTLLPEWAESAEARQRFEREAHTTSFLRHPNVVEVFELGVLEDGTLFLVMERVRGSPVSDLIASGGLHPRRALVLMRQAIQGLGFAHQHGLVHRDLKPDNIMVSCVGEPGRTYEVVKLLDFGVVKLLGVAAAMFGEERLTRTGITFGTPAYMAPEQALGRLVDARADLYAIGVILFEVLTGRVLFDTDDAMQMLRMHVGTPPPTLAQATGEAPWCTAQMETLVGRALAKKPDQRWPDARAFTDAIDAAFRSIDHLG
ncbi:MAG TPA: serine/threonine-protein kinase [Kofleriaceae bacterium]|nr:serine/threonine-protein kinase [Kofleriaceae bacterium]